MDYEKVSASILRAIERRRTYIGAYTVPTTWAFAATLWQKRPGPDRPGRFCYLYLEYLQEKIHFWQVTGKLESSELQFFERSGSCQQMKNLRKPNIQS